MAATIVLAAGQHQSKTPSHIHPSYDGPKLYIAQRVMDLGKVREGTVTTATFVLENHGNQDLIIDNVHADCGCTTVALTDEEKIIKPEGKQDLLVQYDSTKRLGQERKTVTITSNDAVEPLANLILKVDVVTIFAIRPNALVHLRSERRGNELPPIEVYPTTEGAAFESLEVDMPAGLLNYTVEPVTDEHGTQGKRIQMRVPDEIELGRIDGVMMLHGVVNGEDARLPVRVTGLIVGDLVARPASLQSLSPTPRGRRFAPVTIASTNDKVFNILSADAGPHVDVQIEDRKQSKEYAVRATLKDDAPDGPFATTIVVRTDNTGQPLLHIPLFVNVRARYLVEPGVVLLGPRAIDTPRRVRVQSGDPSGFEIHNASCDNPLFIAGVDETQSHMADVKFVMVRLRQGTPPETEVKAELLLKTDIAGAPEVRIPIEYTPER
jgi:hypothetical protein